MYDAFKFYFDEVFQNEYFCLIWDIKKDNEGKEIYKKLVIDHKFENAKEEYINYCCELKQKFNNYDKCDFSHKKIKENGISYNYHSAKLGEEIFKISTSEEIDDEFIKSIIRFLIKHCPDAPKKKPIPPRP